MRTRRRLQREAGNTLIEVLVALSILGLLVVAVVGGMATSILAAQRDHRQAEVQTVLVSAAEVIKDQGLNPYIPCANTAQYEPALAGLDLPDDWGPTGGAKVTDVRHWNGSSFSGCPGQGLQRVSILVEAPNFGLQGRLDVVKRNPA